MMPSATNRDKLNQGWRSDRIASRWLLAIGALLLMLVGSNALASLPIEPKLPLPTEESDAVFQRLNAMIDQSLSREEHELLSDARDGKFDCFTLLDAAFVAGGIHDPATRVRYQQQFDGWVKKIDIQLKDLRNHGASDPLLARFIFEFMHREILTGGYELQATNLKSIFEERRFNCVSATLLYCCLAAEFDLDVRGLETVGHAMSCLVLPNEQIEIESTCPRWFHLASDPKRRAELVEKTIGIRPDDKTKNYRLVSEVELVATIYYNRGLDMLAEGNFAGSLVANATALNLDPSNKTAHGNLLAVLNNWAISLAGSGEYLEAIGLLETGIRIDPKFATFHTNILHVHRRWVEDLCKESRYGEAINVLAEGSRRWPEEPWYETHSQKILHYIGVE
jgi:tetratricopeptide (TPR) repeat protein